MKKKADPVRAWALRLSKLKLSPSATPSCKKFAMQTFKKEICKSIILKTGIHPLAAKMTCTYLNKVKKDSFHLTKNPCCLTHQKITNSNLNQGECPKR